MISREAKERQDAARVHGRFGEQHRSAPDVALEIAPADEVTDKHLGKALSAVGISSRQLPGIEEAWEARFGALRMKRAQDPEDVLRQELGEKLRPDNHIHDRGVTPRSDGSIDVEIFNSTSGDSFTVNLSGGPAKQYLVARESMQQRRDVDRLKQKRHDYVSGKSPVWHMLADDDELQQAAILASEAEAALIRYRSRNSNAASLVESSVAAIAALEAGISLTDEQMKAFPKNPHGRQEIAVYEQNHRAEYREPLILMGEINEVAQEWASCQAKVRRLGRALDEARALPEGDLRSYLLDPRPDGKYTDPKTYKTSTYKRYSPLISDFNSAERKLEYQSSRREKLLSGARRVQEVYQAKADELGRLETAHEAARQHLYALGWPGEGIPPSPSSEFRPEPLDGWGY